MASFRNRATIAVVPSLRRSISDSDVRGVGELIRSVVVGTTGAGGQVSAGRRVRSLSLTAAASSSAGGTRNTSRALSGGRRAEGADWDQLRLMRMNVRAGVRTWLRELRWDTAEEDIMTLPTTLSSEQLMKSISPEAAKLLREILSGSCFEELEIQRRKRRTVCDCVTEEEGTTEGGQRTEQRPEQNDGVLAWSNIVHWAECDLAGEEEDVSSLKTEQEWLSSQDPQGKIYYYEENSSKSSWFLPVPGIALHNEEHSSSSPLSKSGTSDSFDGRESSPLNKAASGSGGGPMPDIVNSTPIVKKRHSTGEVSDRILKSRSMLILSDSRKGSEHGSLKNASLPRPLLKSIWSFSRDETEVLVLKEGLLSRTKITEHGKKVRKNWASTYAVLTAQHLSLFKDQKSFASRKPELEIELGGSTLDWTTDKSSRKNVFQLNTNTDLQLLLQSDEAELALEWIEALQEVIKNQVGGVSTCPAMEFLRLRSTSPDPFFDNSVVGEKKSSRLGRAKSTKLKISGSVENISDEKHRIRAQLRKFFIRRPARESLVKKGIYKDESVFGCLLEKLCAREGGQVPNFVQECIAAIESKEENLKTDGIYRASGNLSQVQKIRLQVDQNQLNCLYGEEDVHVLAGSLKLFFREMKEPLIPTSLFEAALVASNLHNKKEKIAKFREIVLKLAKPNRATLHVLLKHLLKVAEYSEFNRMLIPNLAIVFGPTLMWPAVESTNMALDLMQQNFVIEALLLDFDLIFERR